jgi:DNA helicase-2/ATP-dependent DNA helicase PcrA
MCRAVIPDRVEEQLRIARSVGARYFGHLRLASNGKQTDVLLGSESRSKAGLSVLDWRTAPLAEVFFGYGEGEDYGVEIEGRHLEGTVLQRNLVTFSGADVVEVQTPRARFLRDGDEWRELPVPERPTLRTASPHRAPLLDPAQQRAVDLPPGGALLLLGEAGAGKTTVALHRVVTLQRRTKKRFRAAVVVPTEGLRRLSRSLLDRLGAPDVDVHLYDKFAAKQARRVFRKLPRRESQSARASVIRFKRHEALRSLLRDLPARAVTSRADLHELFGDRALVARMVHEAGLPLPTISDVLEHTRIQFSNTTEEEFSGTQASALQTLDGLKIDEGTVREDARTIDVEDYAVLFELDLVRGGTARPPRYDCIVVDEAQELAPLELGLIGRSLKPKGTLIVAGDREQQLDDTARFRGWHETMRELGAERHERVELEIGYRCPPEVESFARELRAARPARYPCARFSSEVHVSSWLVEALQDLVTKDHSSSTAVICRSREAATQLAWTLRHGVEARLALDGDFSFRPGIEVTCVEEVKGLEFDQVIIPDLEAYGATDQSRHALYVASTRASDQLVLAAAGRPSPLVDLSSPERTSAC